MLIKRIKLVQKREKRKENLHGHPSKLENMKMEAGEEEMWLPC